MWPHKWLEAKRWEADRVLRERSVGELAELGMEVLK